jgi:hypothetical protein
MNRTLPEEETPPPTPEADTAVAEFAEGDAMIDFYASASPAFARDAALITQRLGSLRIFAVASVPSAFFNRVIGLGVAEPATPAMLDDAIALLEKAGCRHYMLQLVPHAQPDDVSKWLLARGFVAGLNWAKMQRGTEPVVERPCALRIEEVGGEYADAFAAIALDAFSMPTVLGHMTGAHLGKPGWRNYLAFDGVRPVAGGSMRIAGDIGWMGLGATLASHRGRGAQSALITRRVADGIAAGCRTFYAEAAEAAAGERNPTYDNMVRNGFARLYLRRNYVKRPAVT